MVWVDEGEESMYRHCMQQEVENEEHFLLRCGYVAEERGDGEMIE